MKVCNKCKIEKSYDEFSKSKLSKGGIRATCKKCCAEYSAEYRKLNPESCLAQSIEWRKNNPGVSAKISKRWRDNNPGAQKESTRCYLLRNKEKAADTKKAWKQRNKEACRSHQQRRRAAKIKSEGSHTAKDVALILINQQNRCANCSERLADDGPEKYHVDHIFPLSKGGRDDPGNLQCLCPKCNKRKHAKDPIDWAKENGRLI